MTASLQLAVSQCAGALMASKESLLVPVNDTELKENDIVLCEVVPQAFVSMPYPFNCASVSQHSAPQPIRFIVKRQQAAQHSDAAVSASGDEERGDLSLALYSPDCAELYPVKIPEDGKGLYKLLVNQMLETNGNAPTDQALHGIHPYHRFLRHYLASTI